MSRWWHFSKQSCRSSLNIFLYKSILHFYKTYLHGLQLTPNHKKGSRSQENFSKLAVARARRYRFSLARKPNLYMEFITINSDLYWLRLVFYRFCLTTVGSIHTVCTIWDVQIPEWSSGTLLKAINWIRFKYHIFKLLFKSMVQLYKTLIDIM